jgi:hypothetical protein
MGIPPKPSLVTFMPVLPSFIFSINIPFLTYPPAPFP